MPASRSFFVYQTAAAGLKKVVEHVDSAPVDGGWHRLTVTTRPKAAQADAAIGHALQSGGAAVRRLHREDATLEQMFVRLIETTPAAKGKTAAVPEIAT